MKTTLMALLGLMCFTFLACAADITGKYTAEIPGRGGTPTQTTFTFKTSGEKVEGTVSGMGGDTPISEGKLSGDTLSFVVVRNFNGNDFKISYTGKVKDDSIDFSMDMGRGNPRTFTAKKTQ